MSERNVGTILLGILAIAGLGLSGYMFITDNTLFPTSDTGLILVGLWDDLDNNMAYAPHNLAGNWLIGFSNSPYNNSDYISMSRDNTRFILAPGTYKITLTLLFQSILSSETYATTLLKNSVTLSHLDYCGNELGSDSAWYYFSTSIYVTGNGVDYFEIFCWSAGGDAFSPTSNNAYNQISIEYVK